MAQRLYRKRTGAKLGGVCGGLGDYLGIDPTIIRLIFILLLLGHGAGLLIYVLLWIVVPFEPAGTEAAQDAGAETSSAALEEHREGAAPREHEQRRGDSGTVALFFGGVLVVLGLILLLNNFRFRFWLPWWFRLQYLWPLLLIAGGALLLLRRSER